MSPIIVQAIGFVGVLFYLISFQIKSNKMLFLMQMIGTVMFAVQFLLLGAISGMASLVGVIIRNMFLVKYRDWAWVRSRWMEGFFVAAFVVICIVTWTGPISLLPLLGAAGATVAYWTDNAQKIRLGTLVCVSPSWLIYDIIVGSWAGVLNESIILISIFISIWRFGWKEMGRSDSGF